MSNRYSLPLTIGSIAILLILLIWRVATPLTLAAADLPVYTDSLTSGWVRWPWDGATVNLGNANPTYSGTASIAITYDAGWSGFIIGYHSEYLDVSDYDVLRFWINGDGSGGYPITVQYGGLEKVITPTAGGWTQVDISLLELGSPRSIYSLAWFNDSPNARPTFYLDEIKFVSTGVIPPTPQPGAGPALSVDASAERRAISPYIYGMNFADEDLAQELRLPARRWGGNSTTRYNWQIGVHNTGSDWYYENIPDAISGTLPAGSASNQFIEQDRRTETKTIMTIPLIGWTPKQRVGGHPYDCGFKVSKYGEQASVDPWDTDCGNGVYSGGGDITGNDPLDTSIAITPTFVQGWINHLTSRHGTAENGGVMFYNLDNEPMLWPSTHRDVHPSLTTYDEMRDRTYEYAAAIKAADPSAKTLGPVVWGWCAYFYSALDDCSPSGSDYQSHGSVGFVEWYLQQMLAYEQQHGARILDYVDVHIYPQIEGVYSENLGSAQVQAARLRSTRQLWDRTYVHEGWIGEPVYLIPRMHEWVNDNYPGTKTAITEYNWGALGHINGALAQADLLGIFGREGLDLATLWGPPSSDQPGAYAFRMYLNYDGQHGQFGDTSVRAASADQEKLAIYAAQRASDNALTLMIINKTGTELTSTATISNFTPAPAAQVYRYSAENLGAIVQQPDQAINPNGFTAMFPASSVTLYIIPAHVPKVDFVAAPTSGLAPLTVVFTNTSSVSYTASLWDFGDGMTGTLLNPTHVYTAGVFTVSLSISGGPSGTLSLTRPSYITAIDPLLVSYTITKSAVPSGRVNQGSLLTYSLLVSATPGVPFGIYDPLTGTTFVRFVERPNGIVHANNTITGALTMPPAPVAIRFVVQVNTPITVGHTASVTNTACVYIFPGSLALCRWSNSVVNPTFHPYRVYLPIVLRNS